MRFGLIGFGEAGRAIAASLLQERTDLSITAYDKLFGEKPSEIAPLEGVEFVKDPAALAAASDFIISVVTADEAVNAIASIAPFLEIHHIIADGNSVSEAAISSMPTVRAFDASTTEYKEFKECMEKYLSLNIKSAIAYSGYATCSTSLPQLVTA